MQVSERQTIFLDEQIGIGNENTVHLGHTENGPDQSVIKIPRLLGAWQDQSTETKIAYLDVLRKYGFPILPTVIHDRPDIVDKKKRQKIHCPKRQRITTSKTSAQPYFHRPPRSSNHEPNARFCSKG